MKTLYFAIKYEVIIHFHSSTHGTNTDNNDATPFFSIYDRHCTSTSEGIYRKEGMNSHPINHLYHVLFRLMQRVHFSPFTNERTFFLFGLSLGVFFFVLRYEKCLNFIHIVFATPFSHQCQ